MTTGRPRPARGPARFREQDVVRVIKAARKAGIPIAAVEIAVDGAIRLIPGLPESMTAPNPLDDMKI